MTKNIAFKSSIRMLFVCVVLVLTTGCSNSQKFIAIDADTLKPIYGVHTIVEIVDTNYFSTLGAQVRPGPSTDWAGKADVYGFGFGWNSRNFVEFFCKGYYEAGFYGPTEEGVGQIQRRVPSSEDASGQIRCPAERDLNGAIVIKLKRAPGGEEDVALYEWGADPRRIQRTGADHHIVQDYNQTLVPQGVSIRPFPR